METWEEVEETVTARALRAAAKDPTREDLTAKILARLVRYHGRSAWTLAEIIGVRLDQLSAADAGLLDTERPFRLTIDGEPAGEVWATSPEEALEEIDPAEWVDLRRGPYVGAHHAACDVTGESASEMRVADQVPPACDDARGHFWADGLLASPRPNGSGVYIRAKCLLCGLCRTVDTAYTHHESGRVVDDAVVTYERGAPVEGEPGTVGVFRDAEGGGRWRVRFGRSGQPVKVWRDGDDEPRNDDEDVGGNVAS